MIARPRRLGATWATWLGLLGWGCAAHSSPALAPTAAAPSQARAGATGDPRDADWRDVFDAPAIFAVVRPRAIRQDRVYGPLLRRAIQLAREQSKVVAAPRMAESLEDAEEVVLGTSSPASGGAEPEAVLVENGVRSDIDPATLVDDEGHPLWATGPSGPVRELVHESGGRGRDPGTSLFELPGRTWVIASGRARDRGREAFAHPLHHRIPAYAASDPRDLAFLRVDGPELVSHVQQLHGQGALAAVGRHLLATTVSLAPGAEHVVRMVLEYSEDDAAAAAQGVLTDTFSALGRTKLAAFSWLGKASVERPSRTAPSAPTVVVTAPLPEELIVALLSAGAPAALP